jgi:hypothetical protein
MCGLAGSAADPKAPVPRRQRPRLLRPSGEDCPNRTKSIDLVQEGRFGERWRRERPGTQITPGAEVASKPDVGYRLGGGVGAVEVAEEQVGPAHMDLADRLVSAASTRRPRRTRARVAARRPQRFLPRAGAGADRRQEPGRGSSAARADRGGGTHGPRGGSRRASPGSPAACHGWRERLVALTLQALGVQERLAATFEGLFLVLRGRRRGTDDGPLAVDRLAQLRAGQRAGRLVSAARDIDLQFHQIHEKGGAPV